MVDAHEMERLAFIRYLYLKAVDESFRPEPLCASAVLTFHDAVEMFLQLGTEHVHAVTGKRGPDFHEYWSLIEAQLDGAKLTHLESMKRFNKARVDLKHYGILPNRLTIEGFRASTTEFLETNTPTIFGIQFAEVSMVNLVQLESARNELSNAEAAWKAGDKRGAFTNLALAMERLIEDYTNRKRDRWGDSPFKFGENFHWNRGSRIKIDRDLSSFIDDVSKTISELQRSVKIMALGIDYRKYSRFQSLTPPVSWNINNNPITYPLPDEKLELLTREEYDFCINFIVESSLHFQGFDYGEDEFLKHLSKRKPAGTNLHDSETN